MPEHLIRLLHAAYAAPADGVTDAELLARVASRDDSAFELLVRRHAAPVWRVCRSVARDHHAAEDAFQAVFLALARHAAVVRDRSAAGWLARVAYHAALKARPAAGPPPTAEPASPAPGPAEAAERSEIGPTIHAELNRLPEAYRLPIVLCHLHGFSQQEAAAQLGLPVGTVASRVSRGMARLRGRLTRRGVAVPAAGVAVVLAEASAVPPELVSAARLGAAAPAHITRLSAGALSAMTPVTRKAVTVVALFAAAVFGTAWAVGPAEPPPGPATKPPAAAPMRPAPSTFAQRSKSRANLGRIAQAIHDYHDAHDRFPVDIVGTDGKPLLSWRVVILPHLDQDYLYAQFKLDEPWDSEHNRKLLPFMPRVFRSPVQAGAGASETYVRGFAGPGAGFDPGQKLTIPDFPDGTSTTLMLAEAGPAVPWAKPADLAYDPKKPLPAMDGPYADRIVVTFWDGSAADLRWNLDEKVYRDLIGRADGMVTPSDVFAPPGPPEAEEDKKLVARSRKRLADRAAALTQLEADRAELRAELEKTGGVPDVPGLGPDAGVEDWKRVEQRMERREWLVGEEVEWLRQELRKRKKDRKE